MTAARRRVVPAACAAAIVLAGIVTGGWSRGHAATRAGAVYVAPTGSDAASCTRRSPCRTFNRAYHAALPGQTIRIAGGHYPPQTVRVDTSKVDARANVTFVPAPGATVTVDGDLVMYGSHAVFRSPSPKRFRVRNLWSQAVRGPATSNHVTFDGLHAATFSVGPNLAITLRRLDVGPNVIQDNDEENTIGPDGNIRNQWPRRIVLDRVFIHDQQSRDLASNHNGGLALISGHGLTIERSRFARDVVYDIEVQDFTNPECCGMKFGNWTDVTLENNWFGAPVEGLPDGTRNDEQPEVQLDPRGGPWRNWLIRRNSFANGLAIAFDGPGTAYDDFRVVGNVGGGGDCDEARGSLWRANVWANGGCGRRAAYAFTLVAGRLRADARRAQAVRRVFALAAQGRSPAAISRAVRGYPAPRGGWGVEAVRTIVADRMYLAGAYGPPGANPGLVSRRRWHAAQRVLAK